MRRLVIVLFVMCFVCTSAGLVAASETEEKEPIKIGVVLPMSPPGAYASGNPM